MLAEIPIISPIFQGLLDALGSVLAWLYDIIPNYGVAIIILTLVLRFLLFPLGMKQIKSMQAMQALQPKIKEIQKRYKGNKQKAQEETMRLYKEAGVNPLGGCLPVLAQFPLLIAMYAVLRAPGYEPVTENDQVTAYVITNNHLPTDSALFASVVTHEGTGFLGLNLQCSASQAGSVENSTIKDSQGNVVNPGLPLEGDDGQPLDSFESKPVLPCGTDGLTSKIGYVLLLGLMIATSFYQTLQTQRASPQGAASNQQQMILRIMPLFFGFIGFSFPAGLVLYWTVSNLFMIGQQTLLLRAGHIGPEALDRRMAEQKAKMAAQADKPKKQGLMTRMTERAEEERKRREAEAKKNPPKKGGSAQRKPKKPGSGGKGGS
ncbi:MAG TPA: YidC/Oxa1 family membrane protein insertase [Actinomycetota bacterium]|nr:YidC/Oxa1 family membrane protein insertase [Actinomycetota bacterium]